MAGRSESGGEEAGEDSTWEGRREGGQATQGAAEVADDETEAPLGRQPADRKGLWRCTGAGFIAAMPDWKRDVGRRLDAIVTRTVPRVRKAVKWNSPFYGLEDNLWFASFHVFAKYVKVTFFRGSSLRPPPAGKSKYEAVRYYDIHEGQLDEAQFADWVRQASKLPGEKM